MSKRLGCRTGCGLTLLCFDSPIESGSGLSVLPRKGIKSLSLLIVRFRLSNEYFAFAFAMKLLLPVFLFRPGSSSNCRTISLTLDVGSIEASEEEVRSKVGGVGGLGSVTGTLGGTTTGSGVAIGSGEGAGTSTGVGTRTGGAAGGGIGVESAALVDFAGIVCFSTY
jgi:hypothetical protein